MPPRVTLDQRNQIPVTPQDEGLLVYVQSPLGSSLQLYDGNQWVIVYSLITLEPQVLAGWEVSGLIGSGDSPFAATTANPAVTIGGLTRGAGLSTGALNNVWGGTNWETVDNDKQNAIEEDNFFTFTITPNVGELLSLTSISPYNIRRSGTGPSNFVWQYSIDGSNFIDITETLTTLNTTAAGNNLAAINLSNISDLQELDENTTVTFRIVAWGATNNGGTFYINNIASDDLIVNGVVLE